MLGPQGGGGGEGATDASDLSWHIVIISDSGQLQSAEL